jgi:HAMP domain-containing protein
MDRAHAIHIDDLHQRIRSRDERYHSDIDTIKTREETKLMRMKQEMAAAEKRAAKLSKATRRLEGENEARLAETAREMDKMKVRKNTPVGDVSEELSELESLKKEVSELWKMRKTTESDLLLKREENERLKREIGRFRHEIAFANRGPQKNRR